LLPEAFGSWFLVIDDDVPRGATFGKVFVDEVLRKEFRVITRMIFLFFSYFTYNISTKILKIF
jgi:hypothetical protein